MMEVFPNETADVIFKYEKYKKIEFIIPYLIEIFKKIDLLMGKNIFMTDLKP